MSEILGRVRASSWGDLFDCSYRWYWKEIMGVRRPAGGALIVGSAVHKGSAVYDSARLEGRPANIEAAVTAAEEYAKAPTNEDGTPQEVEWNDEDKIGRGEAIDYAVKFTAKYCREFAPKLEFSAVEIKCRGLDVTTSEGVIRLTGTTDRVRVYSPGIEGIGDYKTGGKAVVGIKEDKPRAVTKGHQLQLGAYTLMTEQETKKKLEGPASIIGFQTTSKLHIAEGRVDNPKRALVGTADRPGMIELAGRMLYSGVFPPNPKSVLCSKQWCPAWDHCIYHE